MAKNDNLTDFLTDVANAIRDKQGTTDPINPQNFSELIANIGGEIPIKCGTFGATKSPYTLAHNLGVIPDIFIVYTDTVTVGSKHLIMSIGFSSKFLEKNPTLPHGMIEVGGAGTSNYLNISSFDTGFNITGTYGPFTNATETQITIGYTKYSMNISSTAKYTWLAIGGLA